MEPGFIQHTDTLLLLLQGEALSLLCSSRAIVSWGKWGWEAGKGRVAQRSWHCQGPAWEVAALTYMALIDSFWSHHLVDKQRAVCRNSTVSSRNFLLSQQCVTLLILAGLASQKIYIGENQRALLSTPAPQHFPIPSQLRLWEKNMPSTHYSWWHPWIGLSHPKAISSRGWRKQISVDEQIKIHPWSLKVKMQNASTMWREHPSLNSRQTMTGETRSLLFQVSGTSPIQSCWRLGSGPRHDFDLIKEKIHFIMGCLL